MALRWRNCISASPLPPANPLKCAAVFLIDFYCSSIYSPFDVMQCTSPLFLAPCIDDIFSLLFNFFLSWHCDRSCEASKKSFWLLAHLRQSLLSSIIATYLSGTAVCIPGHKCMGPLMSTLELPPVTFVCREPLTFEQALLILKNPLLRVWRYFLFSLSLSLFFFFF